MDDFYERFLDQMIEVRRKGGAKAVRLHPQQRSLIEAEYRVIHKDGKMFIEGIEILADDRVPYGIWSIDW